MPGASRKAEELGDCLLRQLDQLPIIRFSVCGRWPLMVYCIIAREFWIDGIGWSGERTFHLIVEPFRQGVALAQGCEGEDK